ncbi:MAG: UDP-N-acetylmuramoyl-L-alanyl-D-glutamate--2,6-diaminopimelate ligase [Sedimentisphaerales bacterium]|nr:UDP-N-acetylmuramoyl-L-alanyl-D-glutamate--2,6-diaminopimelate ligase [Sedimentisphaerales bacterium]
MPTAYAMSEKSGAFCSISIKRVVELYAGKAKMVWNRLFLWVLMTFDELVNLVAVEKSPRIAIGARVCIDSRIVRPGDIFVAIDGTTCNGHDFIGQAVAKGASYVVCQAPSKPAPGGGVEVILVEDSARAAGLLAQAAMGSPAEKLTNLAVTGTNGKTTVAYLVRSVIRKAGKRCGLIGTIIYDTCSTDTREAPLTTPDCVSIAEMTAEMVKNGAEYMVAEASSHALSQNRLAGVNFKAAAFTNLAGDHLDYHKTEDDYLAAKARLFTGLRPDATAVLNAQSPHARLIAGQTNARILWYAIDAKADLGGHIESMDTSGTALTLKYAGKRIKITIPLLGLYNVSNCLAAAGLCLASGFDFDTVASGLSNPQPIPGRLEKVDWPGDFSVLIDYAHTDDALKNVLSTLKPLCKGRLIVVFGCGGDRDRTKRPRMARVAEQLADLVVVTSDNPRTEPPEKIIDEILAGFEGETRIVEADRRKAICLAIDAAKANDIVLIAGKGHETYQIIGTQKSHFSDKETALESLKIRE